MGLSRGLAALLYAGLATAANAAPAVWEISDADSHIWVFGSVHVLPGALTWRTPLLNDILAEASKVYFEADIGPLGQAAIMLKMLTGGFKATAPWFEQLTWVQKGELSIVAKAQGLPVEQLKGFDPWLTESILEEKAMEKLGYAPAIGVDSVLQGEIEKEKKGYFETVTGQFAIFAAQPMDEQIERLVASIENMGDVPRSMSTMITAWSTGDTDALAKTIPADPTVGEGFAQVIIRDRNKAWLPTIENMLETNEQDLIVVGAGHTVGDGSVIDLLDQAGFTVKRIQ